MCEDCVWGKRLSDNGIERVSDWWNRAVESTITKKKVLQALTGTFFRRISVQGRKRSVLHW